MQVKLGFTVVADDASEEFTAQMTWCKCDWNDVTFLQDLVVQMLDHSVEAGYTLAMGKGLATPEQIAMTRAIAKGEKVVTTTPPTPPGETGRVRK
jgi:hypothetical protein